MNAQEQYKRHIPEHNMNKALNKEIMMNKETSVSEEDKTSMDRLGITNSSKQIYYYKQHRYENLRMQFVMQNGIISAHRIRSC